MEALKIESDQKGGINLIKLSGSDLKSLSKDLEINIKQWLMLAESTHVIDLSELQTIDTSVISQLLIFQKTLKKVDKKLHIVYPQSAVKDILIERGILQSLGYKENIKDCYSTKQVKAQMKKIDIAMLNPFVEGASKAFEVQIGLAIRPLKPSSKKYIFENGDAIAGILSLDIPNFKGQISICFNKEVFCKVYAALLGEEITNIDSESSDAASELLNMIYGHAKTVLNNQFNLNLQPSIPKAILNPAPTPSTSPVLVLPFESDSGPFRLEIQVD